MVSFFIINRASYCKLEKGYKEKVRVIQAKDTVDDDVMRQSERPWSLTRLSVAGIWMDATQSTERESVTKTHSPASSTHRSSAKWNKKSGNFPIYIPDNQWGLPIFFLPPAWPGWFFIFFCIVLHFFYLSLRPLANQQFQVGQSLVVVVATRASPPPPPLWSWLQTPRIFIWSRAAWFTRRTFFLSNFKKARKKARFDIPHFLQLIRGWHHSSAQEAP